MMNPSPTVREMSAWEANQQLGAVCDTGSFKEPSAQEEALKKLAIRGKRCAF
jgi:hypothetical protein